MPELPEVETIVRQLQIKAAKKTIHKAEVYDKIVDSDIKRLSSVSIEKIWRRAKYIIMELSNGMYLITHLGMTGHFHFVAAEGKSDRKNNLKNFLQDTTKNAPKNTQKNAPKKSPGNTTKNMLKNTPKKALENTPKDYKRFMVAKIIFSDGSFLTHNSIRKFGHMKLLNKWQLQQLLDKHGPEPLDKNFALPRFQDILRKKARANIKTVLMDQSAIAGIGNIYAQEALYFAKISPLRSAGSLSAAESKLLYAEMRRILQQAIKHHGTTVNNYSNLEGHGGFQDYLAIYQQNRCEKNHELSKIMLGGRGTSFCPVCQR